MPTVTDHLRASLLAHAGYIERAAPMPDLERSEWCPEFERLMRNRLVMGALRYAPLAANDGNTEAARQRIASAIARLEAFKATGNAEHLVDVANMCMAAFRFCTHFAPGDDERPL